MTKPKTETISPLASIRIGCAGWSIPRAIAEKFPGDGPHLQRYARQFSAVEINTSFHRPHREQTYARWAASVRDDFRFSVKLPKQITHERRLEDTRAEVEAFLSSVRGLGDRLGCLLVQLPPSLVFDVSVARKFFAHLRKAYPGSLVLEPRHASWFAPAAERLLVKHSIARVAADPAPVPGAEVPGASSSVHYFRLHGSPRIYYSSYSTEFLTSLVAKITSNSHQASEVWCIFDNTAAGEATANALELQSLVHATVPGRTTPKVRRRR